MLLTDFPEDILSILFSFLDSESFLALCRTCKDIYQYRQDPAYWRNATSSTFRLPISPLLKADGARWYWLYKRLRTQTKLYTWGQGLKGNLAPGRSPIFIGGARGRMLNPRRVLPRPGPSYHRTNSSWPTEAHVPDEVGVIADLQCGGWSTSILSSQGKLYTVGSIDSADHREVGESADRFTQLEYLTQSTSAIRQFSSGRRHILALTDDREILSWDRINAKGLKIFCRTGLDFGGKPTRVVAGWAESSAYVPETGIVYWTPVKNNQRDHMLDGLSVKEKIVPGTARSVSNEGQVLEVIAHRVLENWLIWLVSDSKLFACSLNSTSEDQEHPSMHPFEVPGYASSARALHDVQGQFNKFAVFTSTGEVLAGSTEYLSRCAAEARRNPSQNDPAVPSPPEEWARVEDLIALKPADVPALQHNQVISLAFGDHHYHALHINGKITSHGNEPQSCGALGLGDLPSGARFRGMTQRLNFRPDSQLIAAAERRGRQIWFEPEKREWLKFLEEIMKDAGRDNDYVEPLPDLATITESWQEDQRKQVMFSEWIEQEGRHWSDGPARGRDLETAPSETQISEHDFHLDSYFAITIAAAGWHSGALILRDDDLANSIRHKWMKLVPETTEQDGQDDDQQPKMPGHFEREPPEPEEIYVWRMEGFPRVELPDGSEMPGHGNPRIWREGKPTITGLDLT